MKIKKIIAPTMAQAMNQIRNELGNDAVILNSKVIHTGGFLGLFKKRNFEVVAAVDPKPAAPEKPLVKDKARKGLIIQDKKPVFQQQLKPAENKSRNEKIQGMPEEILKEISELKQMLTGISSESLELNEKLPAPITHINQLLKTREVDDVIRQDIVNRLLEKWYVSQGKARIEEVISWASEEIRKDLMATCYNKPFFVKKFINVVGPTGVGKTTTLAKIASEFVIKRKKKIAFITTDTYRIGAIEQLKTYAQILGVPLEVAYNIDDFKHASERFADYEHILIDTAGRNYRNQQYVKDLEEVIDFKEEMETFLVLSLASKQTDMEDIFSQFSIVPVNQFIFTKVDETSNHGAIINLMKKHSLGTAYLTTGQNVPDDIVKATPEAIINTLFGDI